jgi:hypothetical protein
VSFAAVTLFVASQGVFIVVVVYFVIDSVRKLLDTTSYFKESCWKVCQLQSLGDTWYWSIPAAVYFGPNPPDHALVHFLYSSWNTMLQHYNIVWNRRYEAP